MSMSMLMLKCWNVEGRDVQMFGVLCWRVEMLHVDILCWRLRCWIVCMLVSKSWDWSVGMKKLRCWILVCWRHCQVQNSVLGCWCIKLHCVDVTCMHKSEVEMTSGVVTLRWRCWNVNGVECWIHRSEWGYTADGTTVQLGVIQLEFNVNWTRRSSNNKNYLINRNLLNSKKPSNTRVHKM